MEEEERKRVSIPVKKIFQSFHLFRPFPSPTPTGEDRIAVTSFEYLQSFFSLSLYIYFQTDGNKMREHSSIRKGLWDVLKERESTISRNRIKRNTVDFHF